MKLYELIESVFSSRDRLSSGTEITIVNDDGGQYVDVFHKGSGITIRMVNRDKIREINT